jgi:hypothetical protein
MNRDKKNVDMLGTPFMTPARSPLFAPVPLPGNTELKALVRLNLSQVLRDNVKFALQGECVCWGLPFVVDRVAVAHGQAVTLKWPEVRGTWVVCMHTADVDPQPLNAHGFITASRGQGRLNEHLADYVFLYADGTEERAAIRRRHQIGMVTRTWGENCFEAVPHRKPFPVRTTSEQPRQGATRGESQVFTCPNTYGKVPHQGATWGGPKCMWLSRMCWTG